MLLRIGFQTIHKEERSAKGAVRPNQPLPVNVHVASGSPETLEQPAMSMTMEDTLAGQIPGYLGLS